MRGRCKRSRARSPSRGTGRGGGRPTSKAVVSVAEFPTLTASTVTRRPFHPKAVWPPRSRRRYTSGAAFRGGGATRRSLRARTWRSPPGGGSRHQRASPSDAGGRHPEATALAKEACHSEVACSVGLVPHCAGTEVPDAAEITTSSQSRGPRGDLATPGRDPRYPSVRPAPRSESLSVPPGPFEIRPRPASPSGISGEQPASRLRGGPGVCTPVGPSLGSAPRRRVTLRAERPPPFPWQGGSFQSPRRDPQHWRP